MAVFYNLGLTYWCLNRPDQALACVDKAIARSEQYDPALHRCSVEMYLAARPEGYLVESLNQVEEVLAQAGSSFDDKAWAVLRKAEILISQGQENQALEMLNEAEFGASSTARRSARTTASRSPSLAALNDSTSACSYGLSPPHNPSNTTSTDSLSANLPVTASIWFNRASGCAHAESNSEALL